MKILIVEDHISLLEMLRDQLTKAGFVTDTASNGEEALTAIAQGNFDAMILDVGLPKLDGHRVLRFLRTQIKSDLPVIILTARADVESRIEGLNLGADDYVVKPFDIGELAARIHAVLRRPGARTAEILSFCDITFEPSRLHATVAGVTLDLARKEYALLEEFLRAGGRIVIKDQLEDRLYAMHEAITPNAIEAIVSRLRKKIVNARGATQIVTVRGVGYKLADGTS